MPTEDNVQIAFINGCWSKLAETKISTQDRGFLFGDGVYEVIPVYGRKIFAFTEHLQRLKLSLQATSISNPYTDGQWLDLMETLVQKHPWDNQFIYLQVTRGIQDKRDLIPEKNITPTVYAYSNPLIPISEHILRQGIKVITLDDIRWLNCDVKAVTLLPNIMMKLAAKQQNADDAILINRDGFITEGTSSNVFIVKDKQLFTPPNGSEILSGITRLLIERISKHHNIQLTQTALKLCDLENADEIWLTSSTKEILSVNSLNGKPVGSKHPGPIWEVVCKHYSDYKQEFINKL